MPKSRPDGLIESRKVCFDLLPKVSRTFALSIMGLKEPLRQAVCVSYLMCRILDTIEDAPGISASQRWDLMAPFLDCLMDRHALPPHWYQEVAAQLRPRSSPSDFRLLENTDHVLACFRVCEPSARLAMARWITEMGKGMVAWSERMGEGPNTIKMLPSLVALDRYCYYIAGTVGYLLTDLFYVHSALIDRVLFYELQAHAEAFGLGLQKVNIVKDLADDYRRGWCFIPAADLKAHDLSPADVLDPSKWSAFYGAALPVLRSATEHLAQAWHYLSKVPVDEKEIRLLLAYSLFFALETLSLVAEEPAALLRPSKLKISRGDVARIVAACNLKASQPAALEAYYLKTAAPLSAFRDGA